MKLEELQVMFDYELAKLYQCTKGKKNISKVVKRNTERFLLDFYFELGDKEKRY